MVNMCKKWYKEMPDIRSTSVIVILLALLIGMFGISMMTPLFDSKVDFETTVDVEEVESSGQEETDSRRNHQRFEADPVVPLADHGQGTPAMMPEEARHIQSEDRVIVSAEYLDRVSNGVTSSFVTREEVRRLIPPISSLGQAFSDSPFEELEFPLFDGDTVVITELRFTQRGMDSGEFVGTIRGEPEGGHVVLSYVRQAVAGTIHAPSRAEYYEIRTGPGGETSILTQVDPGEIPPCGVCGPESATDVEAEPFYP